MNPLSNKVIKYYKENLYHFYHITILYIQWCEFMAKKWEPG